MTSFHRPVNPLTDFLGRNQLSVPHQYEETFQTSQDVRNLLYERLQPPNGRSKPTEGCWFEGDSRSLNGLCTLKYLLTAISLGPAYLDARPMTPILSTRSRRETQLLNRPRKREVNARGTIVPLKSSLADQLDMELPSMSEAPLVLDKIL